MTQSPQTRSTGAVSHIHPTYPWFPRMRSLVYGLQLPFEAFRLIITSKSLMLLSLIPIVLTLAFYVLAIDQLGSWVDGQVSNYLTSWELDPNGWAMAAFQWVVRILLVLVAGFTFAFTATIIASPFNDFLAEKSERYSTPALDQAPGHGVVGQVKLVLIDIVKSLMAAGLAILALMLSLIPVLNVVSIALSFLLVTFQFITYPQTRRGQGFRESMSFLGRHLFACMGFGAVLTFMFSIPFVSAFALPLGVVGGTLLYARSGGSAQDPSLK